MDPALRANRLLAQLDEDTLGALAPRLERVPLLHRQVTYEEGQPMTHAWFPGEGVLSMLAAPSAAQRYSRGHILVTDRAGLERAACGCYRFIRGEYERMFPS